MRIMLVAVAALISGCVTPQVIQAPSSSVDFRQYKTVSYTVHDIPETELGSGEDAIKYAQETIGLFDALLGQRLHSMGYVVSNEAPSLTIDVAVTAVKPGNAAARLIVGFGAGRAVLLFDATFKDLDGNAIGAFQGGRSHTGMEIGQSFANTDEIKSFAVTRSVQQIEQFMTQGSSTPSDR